MRKRVANANMRGDAACCLPSGLSPSVSEFHRVNRSCKQERVADYHRRFGLTPTPEHVRDRV
ncbi:hypothetical protein ATK74_1649 [Propionicimonas paludicola]|uniref:Uncharacterized protein n=1 Tax=Propionicimonas paludicola TaxID=185243 RepID=A0A2A9CU64_9ACTN|nr:hypothetical protein ATK74_1649 [Propionicimonas paludicola]